MKGNLGKLIVIAIAVGLLFSSHAAAWDGEVYGGWLFDSTLRAQPDGGVAEYVLGMEIGHRMGPVRLYTSTERICDQYVDGGGFHPASTKWTVGGEVFLKWGLVLGVEHMCWHPVDSGGTVEEYDMVKASWRFGEK